MTLAHFSIVEAERDDRKIIAARRRVPDKYFAALRRVQVMPIFSACRRLAQHTSCFQNVQRVIKNKFAGAACATKIKSLKAGTKKPA